MTIDHRICPGVPTFCFMWWIITFIIHITVNFFITMNSYQRLTYPLILLVFKFSSILFHQYCSCNYGYGHMYLYKIGWALLVCLSVRVSVCFIYLPAWNILIVIHMLLYLQEGQQNFLKILFISQVRLTNLKRHVSFILFVTEFISVELNCMPRWHFLIIFFNKKRSCLHEICTIQLK